jgi:hypothetical protein
MPGATQLEPSPLRVAIFDDVVAARGEVFHIPGLAVDVHGHADNATRLCLDAGYALVFMDFQGRIVAISSDPAANALMRAAGADDALATKAHLRSYLVHVGGQHRRGR